MFLLTQLSQTGKKIPHETTKATLTEPIKFNIGDSLNHANEKVNQTITAKFRTDYGLNCPETWGRNLFF